MAEDIVARYVLEVDNVKTQVKVLQDEFKKLSDAEKKAGKDGEDAFKKTTKEAQNTSEATKFFNDKVNDLGKTIVAAFAVEQIISFGKECVQAFGEAERGALKLKTSIGVNGGLQKDFESLLAQSAQLQKTTIFSDDAIQAAQNAALQFGLSADEVEKLIPIIADFASATGQDLQSALSSVIAGTNGAAKALKEYGIKLDEGATPQQNFIKITETLNSKFQGQAELIAGTTLGSISKLTNAWDDAKESIGEFIATKTDLTSFLNFISVSLQEGFNLKNIKIRSQVDPVFNQLNENVERYANQYKKRAETILNKTGGDLSKLNETALDLVQKQIEDNQKFLEEQAADNRSTIFFERKIELLENIKAKIKSGIKNETVDYTKLNKEQLEALAADNNKWAVDELDRRAALSKKLAEEQKKANEELKKFAAEYNQKAIEETAKTEEEKLNKVREAELKKAELLFKQAGGAKNTKAEEDYQKAVAAINATYDQQIVEAKIKALEDYYSKAIKENEDNSKNELTVALNNIDIQKNQEILKAQQAAKATADAKGNITKEAAKKLEDEITDIEAKAINDRAKLERDAEVARANEILKLEQEKAKKILDASGNTADAQKQYDTDVKKAIEDNKKAIEVADTKMNKTVTDNAVNTGKKQIEVSDESTKNQLEKYKDYIDKAQELANELFGIFDQIVSADIQRREEELARQDEQNQLQLESNQRLFDQRIIGAEEFEKRRNSIEQQGLANQKKIQDEIKKLKRQEDIAKRSQAIFNIIVDTAQAIAEKLENPFLVGLIATLGAAQIAAVLATPLPKYAKGTKYLERGSNPIGTDTIPILADEGERIVPRNQNEKYWDIYEAIDSGRFNDYMDKKFIVPALSKQQIAFKKNEINTYSNQIANTIKIDSDTLANKIGAELEWRNRKGITVKGMDQLIETFNTTIDKRKL